MDLGKVGLILSLFSLLLSVRGGDIVHDDDRAPKKPGCENDFVLVSLKYSNFSPTHFLFARVFIWVSLNFDLLSFFSVYLPTLEMESGIEFVVNPFACLDCTL